MRYIPKTILLCDETSCYYTYAHITVHFYMNHIIIIIIVILQLQKLAPVYGFIVLNKYTIF